MCKSADTFPVDWDAKTIGDIACHIGSGATPTGGSSVYSKTGITFIRSQNVTFKGLLLDDVAFIGTSIHQQMARSEIFPHDVLLNITGASIGRCCFVPHNFGLANVNQHVCAIRLPKPSHEDAVFLAAVLASHIGKVQIDRLNAGGNREGLNYQQVRSFVVPWPRPEERKSIAAILEAADEAIAKTEEVIAKLKQMRAGLLHDLLTRGLDEYGQLHNPISHPEQFQNSLLGRISQEWEVHTLAECVHSQITYGIVQAGPHVEGGVPYIRTGDMAGNELRMDSLLRTSPGIAAAFRRSEVHTGEIVCAIRATLGKVLEVPPELDGANLTQGTARIAPKPELSSRFILWALRTDAAQRQFMLEAKGTTFPEITLGNLRQVRIAIPRSRKEQERIVHALDAQEKMLRSEERQLSKLQSLKSGLMSDLLTGRIRVPKEIAVAP